MLSWCVFLRKSEVLQSNHCQGWVGLFLWITTRHTKHYATSIFSEVFDFQVLALALTNTCGLAPTGFRSEDPDPHRVPDWVLEWIRRRCLDTNPILPQVPPAPHTWNLALGSTHRIPLRWVLLCVAPTKTWGYIRIPAHPRSSVARKQSPKSVDPRFRALFR